MDGGHKIFTASDRNVDFTNILNHCDAAGRSNTDWQGPGWYRFTSGAGNQMPTSAPPTSHCGTAATGWLQSNHPANLGQISDGKVCFRWSENTCKWFANIKVKNCGGFYLYELPQVPICNLRYCGTD